MKRLAALLLAALLVTGLVSLGSAESAATLRIGTDAEPIG